MNPSSVKPLVYLDFAIEKGKRSLNLSRSWRTFKGFFQDFKPSAMTFLQELGGLTLSVLPITSNL